MKMLDGTHTLHAAHGGDHADLAAKSARRCSVQLAEECRQRVEFVLGQVDLTETVERRWLDVPELSEQERAKLEAARVAEPCERLQALEEAFEEGQFDFVTNLLACSYSRCGCFCR